MRVANIGRYLRYPHKASALKYLFANPSLALSLMSDLPSMWYFSLAARRALGRGVVLPQYDMLPGRFVDHLRMNGYSPSDHVGLLLYLIMRTLKPDTVVETGVGTQGVSSAFILCALHENDKGRLYSIDLPPWEGATRVSDEKTESLTFVCSDGQLHRAGNQKVVGKLVPEYLKYRWILIDGDSRVELPELLKRVGSISMFLHDSLHTFDHMTFEYETAWSHIEKDGFLMSHDILWNDAFRLFCRRVNEKPVIYCSFGLIRKSPRR